MARLRVRYARRGRLRFASHRDVARALERALRQAAIPVAFSGGFTRHPRISYAGAAPTGTASEAEYLEVALRELVDPEQFAARVDAALPVGIDVLEVVPARPDAASLAEALQGSRWEVVLPGTAPALAAAAVAQFLAMERVPVQRLTRDGRREVDARAAVVSLSVRDAGYAILDLVVRQATPAARPDDVLTGLLAVAGLQVAVAAKATRLAQGPLGPSGELADPLAADRGELAADSSPSPRGTSVPVVAGPPPGG